MQHLADCKGFSLVLRTSDIGELSIDPRELVQSKLVVYQQGIDVTNDVIAARNAKHPAVRK